MKSNASVEAGGGKPGSAWWHPWALARAGISIGLVGALLYWNSIDLRAVAKLGDSLWMVGAAGALIFLTLPLGALRWAILLRVLDIGIPLVPVFHIQCISTFFNQLLFGPTSGDAIRGVYAWRLLRRGAGRIAISVVVDRAVGLLGLLVLAFLLMTLRWHRVAEVPQLMWLLWSTAASLAAGFAACLAMLVAPELLSRLEVLVQGYSRLSRVLARARDLFIVLRGRPAALAAALGLALLGQCATLLAFMIIADILHVGSLTTRDYAVAAPLALVANTLPFTPGGLGVGEAAFDHLCRWLELVPGAAPYATIFFAFRIVSTLTLLLGLVSFVVHRSDSGR
jgi:glycosyltransferase 2 family protein